MTFTPYTVKNKVLGGEKIGWLADAPSCDLTSVGEDYEGPLSKQMRHHEEHGGVGKICRQGDLPKSALHYSGGIVKSRSWRVECSGDVIKNKHDWVPLWVLCHTSAMLPDST
jgi:hypothetical protein